MLPSAARDEMFRPHVAFDGIPNVDGYGYGWLVGSLHEQPVYLHPGDNPGYAAYNAVMPTMQIRVILLSNDETIDVFTPATTFLEAALSS